MRETQESIEEWRLATFGVGGTNMRMAVRANEEMAELLRALSVNDTNHQAVSEMADVMILLYGLASRLGVQLHDLVDMKMAVNREREWSQDGSGHGYHVRTKEV